jgi:hypothetical protein
MNCHLIDRLHHWDSEYGSRMSSLSEQTKGEQMLFNGLKSQLLAQRLTEDFFAGGFRPNASKKSSSN